MGTYKLTNVTNLAGKRDFKFNSVLDIEYIDNMMKKTVKLKPGDSLYLTVPTLPLSVHRLRVKKLIVVTEVSATELEKAQTAQPKPKEVVKESVVAKEDEAAKKTSKKKYSKKGY
jgi:hypothetical protein